MDSNEKTFRPDSLTGAERVAVVMLALGDSHGRPLWDLMDEDEIRDITQSMVNLGAVPSELVESTVIEFASQITSTGALRGSYESAERLLGNLLGDDRVDTIMEEIRGPAGRTMWDKLGNVNESVLANYLKNEYPQTVAVVVSKVKPDHAARVLAELPEDFAFEVVVRMLKMEAVQKDILDKVEQTLRVEFMSNLAQTSRQDSHELIADIFNNLDRNTESRFLSALEDHDQDDAERIRALMFTFEDLGKLDAAGIQTLLREVDKDKLGLALKGASETLRDLFFSNMSERASKILREDMENMGAVRLSDVDEAQMGLVTVAKDLAVSGEIMLADNKGDDELIY